MAEPTLKDVLNAISQLRTETKADLAKLDAKVDAHRAETDAHRAETDAHRAETDAHRAETRKGFDDLDKELTAHAGVHREIEKDLQAVKGRAPRTAARAPRRPRTR